MQREKSNRDHLYEPQVFLYCGPPGTGKTLYASNLSLTTTSKVEFAWIHPCNLWSPALTHNDCDVLVIDEVASGRDFDKFVRALAIGRTHNTALALRTVTGFRKAKPPMRALPHTIVFTSNLPALELIQAAGVNFSIGSHFTCERVNQHIQGGFDIYAMHYS